MHRSTEKGNVVMQRTIHLRKFAVAIVFLAMIVGPSPLTVRADQQVSNDPKPAAAIAHGTHPGASEAVSHTMNSSELAAKVEELSLKVEELSRMVRVLMARDMGTANRDVPTQLQDRPATPAPPAAAPALYTTAAPAINDPESPSGSKIPVVVAAQNKAIPAEAPAKSLGPFRFGGDFRLRLDGIIRPAHNSTASDRPSLPHVQNIRGRYRFRFSIDADMNPAVSFHTQLATGPANNPLTLDQDFTATVVHHPFLINEAWIDIHPAKGLSVQGGKVQEAFADNLRFLFDDDIAFNGFNERYAHEFKKPVAGFRRVEFRAGQYIFSNPNVAVVTPGNLGPTGAVIGSTGRAAQMFHQGIILEQGLSSKAFQQFGADVQIFRNPSQIQFASTAAGVPIIVQNGLGITLSGPIPGTGNATTTSGGAIYSARNFQVARLTYRLDYTGLKSAWQEYPLTLNFQVARNAGTGQPQRDAMLANIKLGRIKSRWDHSFLYMFGIKGANSMISQLTDDDFGTLSGVNIRSHLFRFDLGLAKGIQLQNLLFMQNELRNSGQFPSFFVPLGAYAPRQYRFQEQILFIF
jgi:hypothetical protein